MQSSGIVRNLDALGRIVIPKEIRKKHYINEGDPVIISDEISHIVIKKYRRGCIFCGSEDEVSEYRHVCVCRKCRKSLNK